MRCSHSGNPTFHTGFVTATFSNFPTISLALGKAFFTAGSDNEASRLASLPQTSVTQSAFGSDESSAVGEERPRR